jgi:hypothetical protein
MDNATDRTFHSKGSNLLKFLIVPTLPDGATAIINIDEIAVIRQKTEPGGTPSVAIIMTGGTTVVTAATFDDLSDRLRAEII